MRTLPVAARFYLIILWAIATLGIGYVLLHNTLTAGSLWLLALWLPLFILADYFEVEIEVADGTSARVTVADAPMIFLMAVGGAIGVVSIALGSVIIEKARGLPWYRNLFNAAARSINYLLSFLVYSSLQPADALPFSGPAGLATLLITAAVYYMANTLLVGTVIALVSRQPLLRVYSQTLRTLHWVHFITLPFGAVLAVLWRIDPWLVFPGVVPLIMAQRSFKAIAAWQAESRRSKELARESQQLAAKLERLQDTTTAMIASLEPLAMLETVSARLAALLDVSASWVVLLDATPRLVAARGIGAESPWEAPAYLAELHGRSIRQLGRADVERLHGASAQWQELVIIPLALESRVLGGICLAAERPIALAEDDRRVLLAFGAQAALAMEHARLFEELRHKQDELVRSSKLAALGTFSAGIAHEFNNLLAGILGHAELGLLSADPEEKNEALTVAVKTCLRGKSITRGLLTFARRNDAQRDLHQIRDAVEETLALVERELAKVNVRVERRLQLVPPTICDLGQISQVLLNLITNARDAMLDQGGGVITIELAQKGDQIELAVSDTGSGIPEHMLAQMFQPFVTTKGALGGSTVPGTGLGLAISYGIVESHGGTIVPYSQVGRGTTMTVRLPIAARPPELGAPDGMGRPLPPLRILIVDDEDAVVAPLARLLAGYNHTVRVAAGGAAGLRLYREQRFDLVMSDVVMPGMDGAEFVRRLRAIDPNAQVLVMTGQASSAQTDEMLQAGAFGVVSKPFVIQDLLESIARGFQTRALGA
jgi:signal transduction histidine kinase/CheY-like chemotaxis protein